MRILVLGAMLLVIGFLVGVGYSMVTFADGEAPPIAPDVSMDLFMSRRLCDLEKQMQVQHAEVVSLLRQTGPGRGAASRRGATTSGEGIASESGADERERAIARHEKLRELLAWEADVALRRRWVGASSAEFKAWIGPPDEVSVGADEMVWTYLRKEGDVVKGRCIVRFSGDVVTRADTTSEE